MGILWVTFHCVNKVTVSVLRTTATVLGIKWTERLMLRFVCKISFCLGSLVHPPPHTSDADQEIIQPNVYQQRLQSGLLALEFPRILLSASTSFFLMMSQAKGNADGLSGSTFPRVTLNLPRSLAGHAIQEL